MSLKKNSILYGQGWLNLLMRTHPVQNQRVLVIQLSSLGDACTLIPACRLIQTMGYDITVICREGLEVLWKQFLRCDAVPLEESVWNQTRGLNQDFKNQEFEAVFSTSITPAGAFLASMPKTAARYGMGLSGEKRSGEFLYTDVYRALENQHVWKRFEGLFKLWKPDIQFPDVEAVPPCVSNGGHGILIHPGAKWKPRRWPKDRFGKLADQLIKAGESVRFLIFESETDLLHYFLHELAFDEETVVKTRTVSDLIAAVGACRLFIGNDSGPMHLASLMGKQSVILWGPGHLDRIRPLGCLNHVLIKSIDCRPCRQYLDADRCERGDNLCLKWIPVDEVLSTVQIIGKSS